MTTNEIREMLSAAPAAVDDALRMRLEAYFNDCDLVKFAKYLPEPDPAREAAEEARSIVEETSDLAEEAAPSPETEGTM